ncbi:CAP domain-containing protein [Fodinicola feengrottensis]|uniref:SCP domain-containing protein n=1 Tax=Fodinicola feengrottensis TaxID=435914 RepID=A0ABN2G2V0_9ACTN|nr:CAP domain-containing protein [Fodinicola feengrottensis]
MKTLSLLIALTTALGPSPAHVPANDYVQQVVDLTNQNRQQHGCGNLALNAQLTTAAQGHSDDMATNNYFDHDSPDGRDPGQRISDAGYDWDAWAENIAAGYDTPTAVVDSWMQSAGHRANILNCSLHDIGVGYTVANNADYPNYWTQDFGSQ